MKKTLSQVAFLVCLFLFAGSSIFANQTDVIDFDATGLTKTTSGATVYSNKSFTLGSGAEYTINAAEGNLSAKFLQLQAYDNYGNASNSGMVCTKSAGKVVSVTVKFTANPPTTGNRTLNIYASNTAYASVSELYEASASKVASITNSNGREQTYTFEGDYAYLGLRSDNKTLYLDTIEVQWTGSGSTEEFKYTKVTEAPDDWSGQYLLVAVETPNVFVPQDKANNYVEGTIDGNTISVADYANYTLYVAKVDGGYSIKIDNKYIGGKEDNNALILSDTVIVNTIALNTNGNVDIVSKGTYIRFNDQNTQMRFRYYKATSLGGSTIKEVTLYKANGDVTPPAEWKPDTISVAAAVEACKYAKTHYVDGVIKEISTTAEQITQYGNLTFTLGDIAGADATISCFRLYWQSAEGKFTGSEVAVGDTVRVFGTTSIYTKDGESTNQISNGYVVEVLHKGSTTPEDPVDPEEPPTPETFTLTISAGEGGSVSTEKNGTYEQGAQVTITATADDGYSFIKWSDDNTDNPRTLTMDKNITLEAVFGKKCKYEVLDGKKGTEIWSALHDIIVSHTVLSYSNIWAYKTHADLHEDQTIWDIYSSCTFDMSQHCGDGTFSACECYNREHTLPKSWWGGSKDVPMYTDLHHLFPTDYEANETRSAWPYGEVTDVTWSNELGSKLGNGTYGSTINDECFEPVDEYKGDLARVYFYMITCYNDKDFTKAKGYKMFTYSDGVAGFTDKAKELLLKWHHNDPVSQKELNRNDTVAKLQGNRNPFVDEPDLVEYVWGDKSNSTYHCVNDGSIDPETPDVTYYAVRFYDWDEVLLKKQNVEKGKNATPPDDPVRSGYTFIGWDEDYTNVQRDLNINAVYRKNEDEAIDQINGPIVTARKVLRDGRLYIFFNGEIYNAQGARVE